MPLVVRIDPYALTAEFVTIDVIDRSDKALSDSVSLRQTNAPIAADLVLHARNLTWKFEKGQRYLLRLELVEDGAG